jgi:hypothetical protein
MEHGDISTWAMAFKSQSRACICFNSKILPEFRVTKIACQTDLVNRTAVVRDPYARWCGRREAVRLLPIPIRLAGKNRDEKTINNIDFIPNGVCWNT